MQDLPVFQPLSAKQELFDMLHLASFERELLATLASKNLGLDTKCKSGNISPYSMSRHYSLIYVIAFDVYRGRYLNLTCAEMLNSIWSISEKLNPEVHKRAAEDGRNDSAADEVLFQLESL